MEAKIPSEALKEIFLDRVFILLSAELDRLREILKQNKQLRNKTQEARLLKSVEHSNFGER